MNTHRSRHLKSVVDEKTDFKHVVQTWIESGHTKPHSVFIEIGATEARILLQFSESNRTLNEATIDSYVRDIEAGRWPLTHQGLGFTYSGRMYDGHHRLTAIARIESRVTVQITFGMPDEAVGATDSGRARSQKDRILLGRNIHISGREIAIIRSALQLEKNNPTSHVRHTDEEVLIARERFAEPLQSLRDQFQRKFPAPHWGALVLAFELQPVTVVRFSEAVRSGVNLAEGAPALCLRNWLQNFDYTGADGQLVVACHTLMALRAELDGRPLHRFSYKDQTSILKWLIERKTSAAAARQ